MTTTAQHPSTVRQVSRSAQLRYDTMAAAAAGEWNAEKAYALYLELEDEIDDLRALVREDVALAAAALEADGLSYRQIAARYEVPESRVRRHLAAVDGVRAKDVQEADERAAFLRAQRAAEREAATGPARHRRAGAVAAQTE